MFIARLRLYEMTQLPNWMQSAKTVLLAGWGGLGATKAFPLGPLHPAALWQTDSSRLPVLGFFNNDNLCVGRLLTTHLLTSAQQCTVTVSFGPIKPHRQVCGLWLTLWLLWPIFCLDSDQDFLTGGRYFSLFTRSSSPLSHFMLYILYVCKWQTSYVSKNKAHIQYVCLNKTLLSLAISRLCCFCASYNISQSKRNQDLVLGNTV